MIGFSLSKDSDGVSITGTKRLESRKSISIPTPMIKWDDGEYPFMSELIDSVDLLKSEVYEYIEGKRAPIKHQTIDMFQGEEEEEQQNDKHFADAEI